jgi:hypothetical protein
MQPASTPDSKVPVTVIEFESWLRKETAEVTYRPAIKPERTTRTETIAIRLFNAHPASKEWLATINLEIRTDRCVELRRLTVRYG